MVQGVEGGFRKLFFGNAFARACAQEPIALVSANFAWPKIVGPQKRYFISDTVFVCKWTHFKKCVLRIIALERNKLSRLEKR